MTNKRLIAILILMSWQFAGMAELSAESLGEKSESTADTKLGFVYSGLWEGWKITARDQSWPMNSLSGSEAELKIQSTTLGAGLYEQARMKSSWSWFLEIFGGAVFAYGNYQYLSTDRNSSQDLLNGFAMLGGAVATLSGAFLFADGTHDLSLAVEEYNRTLDGRTSN